MTSRDTEATTSVDAIYKPDWKDKPPLDQRWAQALTGLPCLAFVVRDDEHQKRHHRFSHDGYAISIPLPYHAEITGIEVESGDVYVVLDDETEPRKVSWFSVRPA